MKQVDKENINPANATNCARLSKSLKTCSKQAIPMMRHCHCTSACQCIVSTFDPTNFTNNQLNCSLESLFEEDLSCLKTYCLSKTEDESDKSIINFNKTKKQQCNLTNYCKTLVRVDNAHPDLDDSLDAVMLSKVQEVESNSSLAASPIFAEENAISTDCFDDVKCANRKSPLMSKIRKR